ncbi:MAG: AAA+ ATPase superfamily protein YifB/ComM, associated with DNA recombination [uncultured Lysobacter sp.]|uniref:AAA+ ATPase superfamily protein YifB/ComM, associated with DNA recombination n=1 Tax=uncultured Lysobacter sp. TaxID=271060 RepID=A0A6J4KJA4_9GAMM|nr:MAG: AAA+ ATPase superfamily protein YifB/ComM, associated with DNA recombination [uncultured Lysobacter sp.]
MNLALVHARARSGVHAPAVRVEVHLAGGLPRMSIVGLPEAAVREAKDRVRAAIVCAQFEFPARAITVNLAPADLPKDGGRFDLAIALGILAASGQVPLDALGEYEFLGELALTGELRAVDGVLPAALAAAREGRKLVVPAGNGAEAALAGHVEAWTARTLLEVCAMLDRRKPLPRAQPAPIAPRSECAPDLADVRGQAHARRALEIAAAGEHHLLLVGPPGCGKTLLASRLPGLLPEASDEEALEAAAIASVSGRGLDTSRWRERPFRSPHHTASAVALVGGGAQPRPGEISLAHRGVLFLDELPEWSRQALEVLREPLESGVVTVSRAARSCEFPARFQLVAAMNPCPCGWAGDSSGRCRCSPDAIRRYRARISGPLLDRIDLHVEVPRLPPTELRPDAPAGETTATVRERVVRARALQHARAGRPNARLSPAHMAASCRLESADHDLLERAVEALQLSARSMHRILRVARTIADLAGSESIATAHLAEAIGYRKIDRGERQAA